MFGSPLIGTPIAQASGGAGSFTPALPAGASEGMLSIGFFNSDEHDSAWGAAPANWNSISGFPTSGSGTIEFAANIIYRILPAVPSDPTVAYTESATNDSITCQMVCIPGDFSGAVTDSDVIDIVGTL